MFLAQQSQQLDPLGLILGGSAIAVALASLLVTWKQGQAIRGIETREHEWQAADRKAANVEVTRHSVTRPQADSRGSTQYTHLDYVRLRNTGRAAAHNLVWVLGDVTRIADQRDALDVLYPGEHYDIYIAPSINDPPDSHFSVKWVDENGEHETKRLINL